MPCLFWYRLKREENMRSVFVGAAETPREVFRTVKSRVRQSHGNARGVRGITRRRVSHKNKSKNEKVK